MRRLIVCCVSVFFWKSGLCYVDTIDWELVAAEGYVPYVAHNHDPKECPGRSRCGVLGCERSLCWSGTKAHCQILRPPPHCNIHCLGGCSGPGAHQCHACRGVLAPNSSCTDTCPDGTFNYLDHRCITSLECSLLHTLKQRNSTISSGMDTDRDVWVVWDGSCIQDCPVHMEKSPGWNPGCVPCRGRCRKECDGANVNSIATAQKLRACTHIEGSLEIEIRSGKVMTIAQELEVNLGSIEEIRGSLKITRSFPLLSLKFFKSLTLIRGLEISSENNNSFIVIDNPNLEELFALESRKNGTTSFAILNGKMSIHYNPKLCYHYIEDFAKVLNTTITSIEAPRASNGDKFACKAITLKVRINLKFPNSIGLVIENPQYNNTKCSNYLSRYIAYYVKAPVQNVTIYDQLDECGDNRWKTTDVEDIGEQAEMNPVNGSVYHILTQLEPDTQYAFFIKTYTVCSLGGQSPIQYVRTLPSKPSFPTELHAYSNTSSEIVIAWKKPSNPNGKIVEYIVKGFWQRDDKKFVLERDYCAHPMLQTEASNRISLELFTHSNKAKDCCSKKKPKQDKNPEMMCDNSEQVKGLPSSVAEYDSLQTCEKYIYSFLELNGHESDLDTTEEDSTGKRFPKRVESSKSTFDEEDEQFDSDSLNEDGTYNSFIKHLDAKTTTMTINNLRPYSMYTLGVRACREKHPEESVAQSRLEKRCSQTSLVTIRTRKFEKLDAIDEEGVVVEVMNRTVALSWQEPQIPNGIIVSYHVEYRRTDIEHSKPVKDCFPVEDSNFSRTFLIKDLVPGRYSLRIRATSLAGDGPFTKLFTLVIDEESSLTYGFFIFICIFLLLIGSVIGFIVYWNKKEPLINLLIASVNPEYFSVTPYIEDKWEISRNNIELIKELGKGSFGMVHEGILSPEKIRCAVKTVNVKATPREYIEFLHEASIMKSFCSAHHVVKLLGVVSRGTPPMFVMELMEHGDLKSFLRTCRDSLDVSPPDTSQILKMATQIADGMSYLESCKFVHRDLAARNCMVALDLTVKVGDFGMARDIYETDYYRKGNTGLLPIRWMAPESLSDGVFSSLSDVWSFGVVLWEMATLAEQPYQGLSNEQVLQFVIAGNKLGTPVYCPEPLQAIMIRCWMWKPSIRPTFLKIVSILEQYCDEEFKKVSYFHSEEASDQRRVLYQNLHVEPSQFRQLLKPEPSDVKSVIFSNALWNPTVPGPSHKVKLHSDVKCMNGHAVYCD